MSNYMWLALFATMLATGQLFFKKVGLLMRGKPLSEGLLAIAAAPDLYAALSLYGAATLLWIWILSRVTLSQAYPWVALAMGIVPVLAAVVFHERVGGMYWLGIALVVLGVFVTQYASPSAG